MWSTNVTQDTMTINMSGAICFQLHLHHTKQHQPFRNDFRCLNTKDTPKLLKFVVSGATEILRLFSSFNKNELYEVVQETKYEPSATCVDDVMTVLKSDYDNAYFVTGNFTSEVYAEDCVFEDPTISFSGRELYSRNLKLLVPFFDRPSISLQSITKISNAETESVKASWRLRTYLKLPWKPLISIDGATVYDLDNRFRKVGVFPLLKQLAKYLHRAPGGPFKSVKTINKVFEFASGTTYLVYGYYLV